jgi:putative protease
MEKLEVVLHYGADAVYLAGKQFSLRNFSASFTLAEIKKALEMVHDHHARAYIAVNIFPRNEEIDAIQRYLRRLAPLDVDGIIAADPAIVALARETVPRVPVHLSTQANTTNAAAARFWHAQGVRRINLARELSLAEVAEITRACPDVAFESFVHGAMCVSYSGRCLLSNYLAGRPSNQGKCCQPCRFKYAVVEETRPGQYFPILEDDQGTYIFNSRDLCMIAHLPEMIRSGIRALKIEGRMKSIHYAATTVKIYREAIDAYYASPAHFQPLPHWQRELDKVTGRGYCTGFYLNDPDQTIPSYDAPTPSPHTLAAKVLSSAGGCNALVDVRNQIRTGDAVEIMQTEGLPIAETVEKIFAPEGDEIQVAQPGSRATLRFSATQCHRLDIIRRGGKTRHGNGPGN